MTSTGIEIERKFRLRAAPAPEVLAEHGAIVRRMVQVYLALDGRGGERIRRIETADGVAYRHTHKRRVGRHTFEEHETPIDEAAWTVALERADPARRRIRKTRHVVAHGDQHLEIDVFDDPPGLVVVEVELRHEDEAVTLPAWLGEWQEVTGDPRFFNSALARHDAAVPAWAPAHEAEEAAAPDGAARGIR